jgi:hypothetical protein
MTPSEAHVALCFEAPDSGVIDTLTADLHKCGRHLNKNLKSQFWRRVWVRSIFALVEGGTHFMKVSAFSHHERNTRMFYHLFQSLGKGSPVPMFSELIPINELAVLLDEDTVVSEKGHCQVRESFLPLEKNIRFMFHMLARIYGLSFKPDYGPKGKWACLLKGAKIRNRITHPKTFSEIDVADEELPILRDGCQWYLDTLSAAGVEVMANLSTLEKSIQKWVHTLNPEELFMLWRAFNYETPEAEAPTT